jgi:hypothetical protein
MARGGVSPGRFPESKHFTYPESLEISGLASKKKTLHEDGNFEISYVWEVPEMIIPTKLGM